jgi:uncharacterized YccA/Bax inhibitor family protein
LKEAAFQEAAQESGYRWTVSEQHQKGAMTVAGTATATGVLLALLVLAAWFGWQQVTPPVPVGVSPSGQTVYSGGGIPGWIFGVALVGMLCGLVGSFVPKAARFVGPVYALTFGAAIGGLSAYYEYFFKGIVLQAVLVTLGVFAGMYFLFATRIIKVTRTYVLIVVGAMIGIFAMYLVAAVASLFGANLYFWDNPTPLGILVSLGIAVVAAASLAIDFAFIEQMSHSSAPRYMEWYGALGLTIGIVWLYLRVLQLLSLLRQ